MTDDEVKSQGMTYLEEKKNDRINWRQNGQIGSQIIQ
jgi:hypothetical protein